jgi:hypothetical protein
VPEPIKWISVAQDKNLGNAVLDQSLMQGVFMNSWEEIGFLRSAVLLAAA